MEKPPVVVLAFSSDFLSFSLVGPLFLLTTLLLSGRLGSDCSCGTTAASTGVQVSCRESKSPDRQACK